MRSQWYDGIVVGVDGSAESMAAVDWAALTADRHSARLTVLGAYATVPSSRYGVVGIDGTDLAADARDAVEQAVARLDGARPGGYQVDQRVVLGDPVDMLARRSTSSDLVVVGRRGLAARGRTVLGSVSGALAASAHGPVAVVPAGARAGDPRRVVVGVSRGNADPQLDVAFAEAQQRSCPLEVVHVLKPDPLMDVDLTGPEPQQGTAEREGVQHQVARWSGKYPAVAATVRFRTANPVEALLDDVGPEDLVVVGGQPHSPVVGRIRYSISDGVLRRSPATVIVVHE
ncbi:nucleotide-binding universal stress UspA family protein [Promicromonospora sp. AC04]|uniref:universal stress protein n=1 Tax=Promicromonospora sp. AC04 TaxID=2135723 RepID=UPI000D3BDB1E|nr:universal stress protein [Promicromonospora sp. AC04]PUB23438.1 nucleotide-binding universal stress UspA family protein [Promicromonospora sp. AC04]